MDLVIALVQIAALRVIGNMKLFERTGGYWIFYISALYLLGSLWSFIQGVPAIWLAPMYVIFLAMPFWFPPLGRAINLRVDWDRRMFNLFGKKDKDSNVVKFPELKEVPKMPEVAPPKKEEPEGKIFYRLGLTDNNRVAFSMGYTEITMNHTGVQQMIDQLKFYQSQLYDEGGPTDDPDGGLPLSEEVENKKAA